jgi:hypothetical protein
MVHPHTAGDPATRTGLPGARETRSRVMTDISSRIATTPPNAQRTTTMVRCSPSSLLHRMQDTASAPPSAASACSG